MQNPDGSRSEGAAVKPEEFPHKTPMGRNGLPWRAMRFARSRALVASGRLRWRRISTVARTSAKCYAYL